jgi:integrase
MNHMPTNRPISAVTMANVIESVGADPKLKDSRRRDLISALHRTCQMLGVAPEHLAADIRSLADRMNTLNAPQARITQKTLVNLRSNTLAAIRMATPKPSRRAPLTPDWQALFERLPNKMLSRGLSRLVHFLSASGISPHQVDDASIALFMHHVRTQTFHSKPNDLHRRTVGYWNRALTAVVAWPQNHLTVPSYRPPARTLPLAAFPVSFAKEVQAHLSWLAGHDLFCQNPPPKPCRPRTVDLRRKHILLAASALVRSGIAPQSIQGLADLVTVDAVKAILSGYLGNRNSEPSQFVRDLAGTLIQVARHWLRADPSHQQQLSDLRRRLGPDRVGLTQKNKETLRQFNDPENVRLLLDLPQRIYRRAARLRSSQPGRAAVQFQIALAIDILLAAPLRMHNLVALKLDQHLVRPHGRRGVMHIVIPPDEAKGGEILEYSLPDHLADSLDRYLRDYRPLLNPKSQHLFVNTKGKSKAQATLAQQINETIHKDIGLTITPHQFRHVAAKLIIDHQGPEFELVRQLLGHRSVKSTTNFYAGVQSLAAGRVYDKIIQGIRAEPTSEKSNRSRKVRS